MLRPAEVLRDRGDDVFVDQHEEVVPLLQQQLVDEEDAGAEQRRVLHLQQYRCLSPGNGLPLGGLASALTLNIGGIFSKGRFARARSRSIHLTPLVIDRKIVL